MTLQRNTSPISGLRRRASKKPAEGDGRLCTYSLALKMKALYSAYP
jgi:hypothetical protein